MSPKVLVKFSIPSVLGMSSQNYLGHSGELVSHCSTDRTVSYHFTNWQAL